MYHTIRAAAPASAPPEAIALALFEGAGELPAACAELDARHFGGHLAALLERPETDLGAGTATLFPPPAAGGPRPLVIGLGAPDHFHAEHLRTGVARAIRLAFGARLRRVRLELDGALAPCLPAPAIARAAGEGAAMGNLLFRAHKGAASPDKAPRDLELALESPEQAALEKGQVIGESANLARRLAATPPNLAHPAFIVEQCREVAENAGLGIDVIDADRAARLGMGGLLAVGASGSRPPALVALEHPGADPAAAPTLVVGKAITFDTGGYSIKTGGSMATMKYDKCGGMAVIGLLQAAARLGWPGRLVGLVPIAENMIGPGAYRPDDILTLANGVTVEVTNTDAEGRLVLADALAWGCGHYRPEAVIDLGTLTGGVVTALGSHCAGCFSTNRDLEDRLRAAGEASGERLWPLPLWREHRTLLKSEHADITNSGGRKAHAIQVAAFLSHFVARDGDFSGLDRLPSLPWAHLDIAGVADVEEDTGLLRPGPTGFGVRLLAEFFDPR